MMKKIALWGAMPKPLTCMTGHGTNLTQVINSAGMNLGNLVIGHSLLNQFENTTYIRDGISPEKVNEEFDVLLIGAANFINPVYDLAGWAKFLEKISLPIVCVGLGAQSAKPVTTLNLKKGTYRFLKILSEKTRTIGVRGAYTAELLNDMGVQNINILGCPSIYFQNGLATQSPSFDQKKVGETLFSASHLRKDILKKGVKLARKNNLRYVAQDEYDFIPHLKRVRYDGDVCDAVYNDRLLGSFNISFYGDVDAWCDAVVDAQFAFGTRMHGNIVSFKAGVPTVWITVDSRTQELCEFHNFPFVTKEKFMRVRSIEKLNDVYNANTFNDTHSKNVEAYLKYISDSAVKENFKFSF